MSAMTDLVRAIESGDLAAVAAAAYALGVAHQPGCSRLVGEFGPTSKRPELGTRDEPGSGGLVPGLDPEVLEAGLRLSERLSDAPVPTQPRSTARRLRAVQS